MDIETITMKPGGVKAGEMTIMMAGRGAGKSTLFNSPGGLQWMQSWISELNKPIPVTDIQLSEGRVYGARYFCVKPVGGSWKEMEQWCIDTFGAHGGAIWGADPNKPPFPCERWYMNNSKFWFRTEKDRDWFIMRWRS